MKINLILLFVIYSFTLSAQTENNTTTLILEVNRQNCSEVNPDSRNIDEVYFKLRCYNKYKDYWDLVKLIKKIETISNLDGIDNPLFQQKYFRALKYSYGFLNRKREHFHAKRIQKTLLDQINQNPKLLIEELNNLYYRIDPGYTIKDFLSHYAFYLFATEEDNYGNLKAISVDFNRVLDKLINRETLKLRLNDLRDVEYYFGGSIPDLAVINLYGKRITFYLEELGLPQKFDQAGMQRDSTIIFDYFALSQWKEAVFLWYESKKDPLAYTEITHDVISKTNFYRLLNLE